ncbi:MULTISPECIES: CPBP family intramembrane metalloprotease [unclassified Pseudomonas]|uniref:CPBP family intramembrane glutamic endopeptidase n=1 Tax=unclassified Pseudomonas TaxID=196821 RepID=UPI00244A6CDE|nr:MULTISPECIES: CPBP family intramembrane metalloprotease [unclassified Pseudomonas]MDG9923673.1 CPBP family intramembrane metalloprotease [Pseudomonas sp. GD04045]MDH0036435.1 CPBP family intramembrane metalloprotease [Pseudomonas sp. GD04019]
MPPLHLRLLLPMLALGMGIALGFIEPLGVALSAVFIAWVLFAETYLPRWLWWSGGLLGGIALAAHLLPGFQPMPLWPPLQLSEDAPPYALRLSWDKLLLGLTLLAWWLGQPSRPAVGPRLALLAGLITLLAVPLAALALGLVGWQPKWPQQLWLWLAVNLGVAVLAEELLFRAWLQPALVARLGTFGGLIATALLFGAAHLPFSPVFALVALLAGLGYGLVFHYSGRLWPAVALHGAVNLTHVLLLSYPLRSA